MKGFLQWIERRMGALAGLGFARPWLALGIAAIVTIAALGAARDIRLSADLTELLPTSFESVKGLGELKKRFGGMGYVVVVGRGSDPEALRRFADDLAPQLEKLPDIRYVDHQRSTDFFEDRALYYLSLEDLQEVQRRVRAREKWERRKHNPLFVSLDDEPAPSLDFSDIEKKYLGGATPTRLASGGERYYLDEKEGMIVLLAKPSGNSADLGYSQQLLQSVRDLLAKQDLSKYGPDFDVALTGTFQKKIDQQNQIAGDVATSSAIAMVLLFAYLFFHFRSVVAIALGMAPVGVGLAATYGVVGVAYGTVNLLTAFLGAILGGLGIEHGIHLIGRYQGLRAEGRTPAESIRESFAHTGAAALVSALVAALTFFSIAVSEFRAFREFGVISALGMLLLVGAYVLVLPAGMALAVRFGLEPKGRDVSNSASAGVGRFLLRFRRPIAGLGAVTLIVLAGASLAVRFDYDFGALEDSSLPSFVLDRKVNEILGHSQTPVVLLTDSPEEERAAVAELKARKEQLGEASTIDFVASIGELVPEQQAEKQEILQSLHRTLSKVDRESIDPDQRARFDRFLAATAAEPFTSADLPEAIRRQFEGVSKGGSGFVLAYPRVSLADGEKVRALAREVRNLQLPSGGTLSASGEPMVLSDILEMVTREAPIVLVAALVSVAVAMWITLGSLGTALLCLAPTVISILALAGAMAATGLPFNYLNILVVPVLIGTTVDAGVHLMTRLGESHEGFVSIYAETGSAIIGGLFTSAVGFGALLLADHPGLESVGFLAVFGFAINAVVMLVVFPSMLLLRNAARRNQLPLASVGEG